MLLSTATPSAFRRLLPDVLLLVVLLALTCKMNYQVWRVRDLGMDDETAYFAHGHYLMTWGLPPACYGPAYICWYHVLDLLPLDRIVVYYGNWILLQYLLAAGQYVLVRALGGFRSGALAVAFLTLTSGMSNVWPFPMHLTTFLLAAGTVVAARMRSRPAMLFILGTTLLVGGFLRPEFTTSFVLFCLIALGYGTWALFKRPEERLRLVGLAVCLVVLAATLFGIFGNPLSGGRSYFAFAQHYSFNVWAEQRVTVDPWTNWKTISSADFGDADSVVQAARNNPRAFAWHLASNLRYLPRRLAIITESQLMLSHSDTVNIHWILVGVLTVGVAGLLLRLFRRSTAAADPAAGRLRIILFMFFLIAAPTGLALLIIWPRDHYLIPLTIFATALAFSGYCGFRFVMERLRWLDAWPALTALVLLLALVTPNRAHRWSIQQLLRPAPAAAAPSLDVQRTVAVLRNLHVHTPQPIGVLEADFSRAFYAGWNFYKVDHWTKTKGFWQFIDEHNIATVVLDERLLKDTRFKDDPEFIAFAAERSARNFRFLAVPQTSVRVAVREDLLPDVGPRLSVVRDLLQSNEYLTELVLKYYQHYLGRTPDSAEVAYWSNLGPYRPSAVGIQAQFLISAEFYGQAGNTDQAWVNAVYRELVGRPAESAEESHCLRQLADGVSRNLVVLGIAATQQRLSRLVQSHYQQYLGRAGSAADIANWPEGVGDEEVLIDILSSAEFYDRAGHTDEAWINALYWNLFNRRATAKEVSDGLQRLVR